MRIRRTCRTVRPSAWLLCLLVASAGCGDDDQDPARETLIVDGVFLDPQGAPLVGAEVSIFVSDSLPKANRMVSTDASGHFSSTFSWSPGTLPVHVQVLARPPLGSGMSVQQGDDEASLPPGQTAVTVAFDFQAVQVDEPVNEIPPASLSQSSVLGRYVGQSVPPLELGVITYLDLDITGTVGSVSGRYDVYYSATTATPAGAILGAVLLDTLRLQLTSDTIPDQPRHVASLKAIATSPSADTLIATPDPCTGAGCWLYMAPIRLIRTH